MKNTGKKSNAARLRQRAEELLKKKQLKTSSQLSEAETLRLIHEMEVHQIELELQNYELALAKEQAGVATGKYIELYDFAPSGYFTLSKEGKIIELNLCGSQMLGKERSWLKNSQFGFFVSDDTKPIFNLFLEKVFNSKTKESCEVILSANSNLPVYVHITGIIAENAEQCLLTVIDITERKHAEIAIRESEEKYRRIFDNIQDLFYETSIEGTILEVSPSIEILSKGQYRRDDLIGKSMYDFYSEANERAALISQIKQRGTVSDFEITLKNRDGSRVPCSISSKILLDAQGCPEKIIGSMRDITERKRAEEELIKAKDKAQESDRLKTAFLHNISHEIRTPMNAIVGFSALLGVPDVDGPTRQSYIEMIILSSNHLLAIINDIVDISNIEANLVQIIKNEININSTLKSLCDQLLPNAIEKKIKLIFETGLSDSDAFVLVDSTKLIQILSNLINNAVKFTDKGYVKVGCTLRDKFLEFYVSDTGIGIPQEHHQRIFDRFYKVENPVSKFYEGTGLGLAISKAYVELQGGEIRLSSKPGEGSTFYFTLPFEKSAVAAKTVPWAKNETNFVFPEKKTILVAEDIDSNFKLISYFLSGANTEIIRASDGKEAVEKALTETNIDLILMDIKMPLIDGYSAAKIIKESKPDIPIIAHTAYADDKTRALEEGCDGFLSKPFDKQKLLSAIMELI